MLTPLQQVLAGVAGLIGGTLSGFFGVGGNVILIPLLVLTLGVSQHQAQALTLAALLPPLGLPAVWQYRRAGVPLSWKVVGVAILGFVLSIPLGSALANLLPANVLRVVFAVLLLFTAVRTWRSAAPQDAKPEASEPPKWSPVEPSGARGWLGTLGAGAGAGFASGLLGIGGAIVLIPLLKRFLGYAQKQAQLTSLALLLPPVALPGVIVYARAQETMPWGAIVPIAAGFVVGAFGGARLNRVVSATRLERGFSVLLAVSALALLLSALRG
ncbi:MAG: sulfite exporter TauE/SafE family protein [Myxococcaceae bacterium]